MPQSNRKPQSHVSDHIMAQSAMFLTTDAHLTADPGLRVRSSPSPKVSWRLSVINPAVYSKLPLKYRQSKDLNDKCKFNEGQKYCRTLPLEYSSIFWPALKTNLWYFESADFTQILVYLLNKIYVS